VSRRIALVGLDGSGKSANINLMKQDHDFGQYHFVWVRWKPFLLKPAYWILKRSLSKKKSGAHDHVAEKTGLKNRLFKNSFVRQIWMAMALIDYFIQFQAKVIFLVLTNKHIVFDRFYLDLFVDQGINFNYSPARIETEIRKWQWLFPRISRYIYLKVSPETCFRRKDDIPSFDYLSQRYEIYECLAKAPGWFVLDGEESLETVYGKIKGLVLSDEWPDNG
jgi:thymidylate kinase